MSDDLLCLQQRAWVIIEKGPDGHEIPLHDDFFATREAAEQHLAVLEQNLINKASEIVTPRLRLVTPEGESVLLEARKAWAKRALSSVSIVHAYL